MNKKRITIFCMSIFIISVVLLVSIPNYAQALTFNQQGSTGNYLKWGATRTYCGYSTISVGIGTGTDTIVQTGKGGLVDLDGSSLAIKIGFVSCLNDYFHDAGGLISIGISVAIYDHNTKSYVNPYSRVLSGSAPIYEAAVDGSTVGLDPVLYWGVSLIISKILLPAGIAQGAMAFIQTPGGITTSYLNNANTAKWRAPAGSGSYTDFDHQEITWDGYLSGLDGSDTHCYEVKIRADILHTGNIDYYMDSVYYNFYLNKKPTVVGGGGGGGIPPVNVID